MNALIIETAKFELWINLEAGQFQRCDDDLPAKNVVGNTFKVNANTVLRIWCVDKLRSCAKARNELGAN